MRVLILGASGMLGHKVYQQFKDRFETFATLRRNAGDLASLPLYADASHVIAGVDAMQFASVQSAIRNVRPDVIVNCIGVIKQVEDAHDMVRLVALNALFPHQVAAEAAAVGARMLHISTDCVFSGRKGNYSESDIADPPEPYGQSKLLGEVKGPNALTLRTSVIGRDFTKEAGLVEWFVAQRGKTVRGYVHATYSGFPTVTMAEILTTIIENHPDLNGLYQVASEPISKYELLTKIRDAMRLDIRIDPYEDFRCDRSLDGSRFGTVTGMRIPSWDEMISRMAGDVTPYDEWKQQIAGS